MFVSGGQAQAAIIGLGQGSTRLCDEALECIARADVVAGGRASLDAFSPPGVERIVVGADVDGALAALALRAGQGLRVVVLCGGDPLYYGLGPPAARALRAFPTRIFPNVGALQEAASRIGLAWEGVRSVSLHGREEWPRLFRLLCTERPVAVYTDVRSSPTLIAQKMLERGVTGRRAWVFERLGRSDERFRSMQIAEMAEDGFAHPNLVLLVRDGETVRDAVGLGLADEVFVHERGLITKSGVRAVVLESLRPGPGMVVWDVGAGSGAVGLEAAGVTGGGEVYCFERKPERAAMIRANRTRLGRYTVEVVEGRCPETFGGQPRPDRLFIGGGLRRGGEMLLAACMEALLPGGRLAASIILLPELGETLAVLERAGWEHGVRQVQISEGRRVAGRLRLAAQNPVFVVFADKPV